MIDFVVVHDATFEIIGIIDTANSIIWHKVYFGVGDFEIYAQATQKHVNLLQRGNYITRPDDDEVGIVERIEITENDQEGLMIVATGRFAKSILERRIIYTLTGKQNSATILRGNVESAARALVANNATACTFNPNRNIPVLQLGAHSGSTQIIVDDNGQATQKQVTNDNLLTYTDALLHEYDMAAKIVFSSDESKLEYKVFQGIDRSMNSPAVLDPVIFSTDFDNLTESDYVSDEINVRTMALVGGEGEGLERFYSAVEGNENGLARREIFIDASGIQKKYKDDQDEEHEYTDAEYKAMLDSRGKQNLSQMIQIESFTGVITTAFGGYELGIDFSLGDIVTVQNNRIGVYANVRITETTEVQDDNGYNVSLIFE